MLVAGAIPGERVTVRVTKAEKQVAFADVIAVLEPSDDRRRDQQRPRMRRLPLRAHRASPPGSAQSGNHSRCLRAHRTHFTAGDADGECGPGAWRIGCGRGFTSGMGAPGSIARTPMTPAIRVRRGSYRSDAVDAVDAAIRAMVAEGVTALSVELAENVAADQRALHVEAASGGSRCKARHRSGSPGRAPHRRHHQRDGWRDVRSWRSDRHRPALRADRRTRRHRRTAPTPTGVLSGKPVPRQSTGRRRARRRPRRARS